MMLTLIGVAALYAQAPHQRMAALSAPAKAKQVNTKGHKITANVAKMMPVPAKAEAEAPANAIEVPFTHGLGKDSNFPNLKTEYTAINANNDNRKWQFGSVPGYGACIVPNAEDITENDDWLITPPVHMPAGDYVLSFELGMMGSGATGVRMDVKMGTAPTVEAMTAEIVPQTVYTERAMTKYEYNVNVAEEGYYYIGFHCTTEKATKGTLKLTNVGLRSGSVEPVEPVDPPAAGTLTWELAPKGELKATVKYIAPTKTVSGADLTEITKVLITSRWEVDKFEYTDVTPGQEIVIENVEMYQGTNNRFTAVAYVGETAGEKVEYKNIFCGKDTPLAPENVRLVAADDFKSATLSWDPVGEVGENGGYVDPAAVTYYVFDAFGSYYDPAIATTTETSVKLDYPDLKGQDFVAYQVTAGYGENYSLDKASNIITIGEPAKMPFTESFSNSEFENIWLIDPETSSSNQIYGTMDDEYFPSLADPEDPDSPQPLVSQDGDNGFFYWLPYEKDVMYGQVSVNVDLSTANNPVLEFWYQGQGSMIDVLVAKNGGPLNQVMTIDMQANPTTEGWTMAQVPLTDYKGAKAVQFELRLRAVHNDADHTWSVPIDNIRVRELVDKDLHMVALTAPANVKVGEKLTMKARVENIGEKAENASVEWTVNGKAVGTSALPAIEANGFADISFEYDVPINADEALTIKAEALMEGDGCEANNAAEAAVKVKLNNYPTVADLAGSATGTGTEVLLTWTAPTLDGMAGSKMVNEDFENADYTPMSINGAGGWTVYDGDKQKTYNIFRELYNPYQTQPIGFQLFNRTVAQVPEQYWEDAAPHSGETFMMAPSGQSANNDNWLISPELSGNGQTVSFWAKSFTTAWPESFEVLYSTTDNAPESFTQTVTVENYPADGVVPEVWTEFKATLPAGAKHFAIRHRTYDTLALLVDDVTFEGASDVPEDIALTGYHIFRDGVQITSEPVTETTYTDDPVEAGAADGEYTYTYVVVPVYNYGPAPKSNEVTVDVVSTAIADVNAAGNPSPAVYYNLQGVRVASGNLVPGVYVRVADGRSAKVIVK